MDIILYQKSDITVSSEKPEKFGDDSFPVDLFRREKGKSIREVESELSTEEAIRHISTSEVFVIDTVFDKFASEVEILLFWVERHNNEGIVISTEARHEQSGEILLISRKKDFSTSAIASARNDRN